MRSHNLAHAFNATASLSLIGYAFETLEATPISLRHVLHLEAVLVVDLGTGIAAKHISVISTDLAYFLIGRVVLLSLDLLHVRILSHPCTYDVHLLGVTLPQVRTPRLLLLLLLVEILV